MILGVIKLQGYFFVVGFYINNCFIFSNDILSKE